MRHAAAPRCTTMRVATKVTGRRDAPATRAHVPGGQPPNRSRGRARRHRVRYNREQSFPAELRDFAAAHVATAIRFAGGPRAPSAIAAWTPPDSRGR
jgi:hypothetical protein